MQSHLQGKDAPVEETIVNAYRQFENLGISLEVSSWLNPAPNCWSVHLQASNCPPLYTNGKGTTKNAALASALGEYMERLSTGFLFAEFALEQPVILNGSYYFTPDEASFTPEQIDLINHTVTANGNGQQLLSPNLLDFYNPEKELEFEHLVDNNLNCTPHPVVALPFQTVGTDNKCYFPINLLNNLYVSNGMAAGNSPAESDSQALSEIIERYVKNRVISEGISLPDVPQARLHKYPEVSEILRALKQHGFEVLVKDSSLGGNFPVICVLLLDPSSGGVFAAFGCNCRFEIAIIRTLTELLQGRQLDQLRSFPPPVHQLQLIAEPHNLENHFVDSDGLLCWTMFSSKANYAFSPWDFSGTTKEEFKLLVNIISKLNVTLYKASYTHCHMYSCRFIVPSVSEIYPVDDLVWNNRNKGALLRPLLLRLDTMSSFKLEKLFIEIDDLALDNHLLVSQLIGILFDDSSIWSSLRIGELKAMISIALQDYSSAYDWTTWCLDFGDFSNERRRIYSLLHSILGFTLKGEKLEEYEKILSRIYQSEELKLGQKIIANEIRFWGLNFDENWNKISYAHRQMTRIYNTTIEARMKQGIVDKLQQ